jgi:hypothetical protein
MNQPSHAIMPGAFPLESSEQNVRPRKNWAMAILDALHESRTQQATRVIRDHRHLFAKPEHVAIFMLATREKSDDPAKELTAKGSSTNVSQ